MYFIFFKNLDWLLVALYPINLKNWEFGKAGARSLIQQSGAEAAQLQLVER